MRNAVVSLRDGWLCVEEDAVDSSQPQLVRYWWPVRRYVAHFDEHLLGLPAESGSWCGRWVAREGTGLCSRYYDLELPEGGKTKCLHYEIVPVPCPKVRRGLETRWRRGRWEKCLKREGWVPA